MNIECPKCGFDNDLDGDDLPSHACDDIDYKCKNDDCELVFKIGWYATAELRE